VRPVPKESAQVTVIAKVRRAGKTLSYGDIDFLADGGKLAAHATATYALL
jgi:acyl-coenzyme A thioesterase PaaI-like protein